MADADRGPPDQQSYPQGEGQVDLEAHHSDHQRHEPGPSSAEIAQKPDVDESRSREEAGQDGERKGCQERGEARACADRERQEN